MGPFVPRRVRVHELPAQPTAAFIEDPLEDDPDWEWDDFRDEYARRDVNYEEILRPAPPNINVGAVEHIGRMNMGVLTCDCGWQYPLPNGQWDQGANRAWIDHRTAPIHWGDYDGGILYCRCGWRYYTNTWDNETRHIWDLHRRININEEEDF